MKIVNLLAVLAIALSSCKKENPAPQTTIVFKNVVILGNSITVFPQNDTIGWHGTWGMAASKPEFDYVHILTKQFKSKDSSSTVNIKNISPFERDYANYNLTDLSKLRNSNPDLLIVRIGENVDQKTFNKTLFETRYQALLSYFKSVNPNIRILAVGSFWSNNVVDQIMYNHSEFITLQDLGNDFSNHAWGEFYDEGVASHPSDKGMAAIAQRVWNKIQEIR
jgi:lysophospholipase L1-like esterase